MEFTSTIVTPQPVITDIILGMLQDITPITIHHTTLIGEDITMGTTTDIPMDTGMGITMDTTAIITTRITSTVLITPVTTMALVAVEVATWLLQEPPPTLWATFTRATQEIILLSLPTTIRTLATTHPKQRTPVQIKGIA